MSLIERLGVSRELYETLISAGELAFREITEPSGSLFAKTCLVIGFQPEGDWTQSPEIRRVETVQAAEAILSIGLLTANGESPHTYHGVLEAARQRELTLYCANPDRALLANTKRMLAAGLTVDWYERMGGKCVLFGKPGAAIYQHCRSMLEAIPTNRIAAIGDSVETDIKGGNEAGIPSILVTQTGIHSDVLHPASRRDLDYDALNQLCSAFGTFPCGILHRLSV